MYKSEIGIYGLEDKIGENEIPIYFHFVELDVEFGK